VPALSDETAVGVTSMELELKELQQKSFFLKQDFSIGVDRYTQYFRVVVDTMI
jgi:hypothetical protein